MLLTVMLLTGAGMAARAHAHFRSPVAPLTCAGVVELDTSDGERLACTSDPAFAGCQGIRAGRTYRGCAEKGPMRGALLKLTDMPVDVARASADDLRALPGIGPGLAARIIEARQRAPLCELADLEHVSGIGARRVQALAGHVELSDPRCAHATGQ